MSAIEDNFSIGLLFASRCETWGQFSFTYILFCQFLVVYLQQRQTTMNYYIIARKNNNTKQVEYLKVLECKRHVWLSDINATDTVFNNPQMNSKCKTLNKYGKKTCRYYPIYIYQQDAIFNKE